MNHTQFIVAMTIVLFLAFGLGWFASWLTHRLTRVTQANLSDLDEMARNLHDAEESREEALSYFEQRERDLMTQLAQSNADLRAAMEGLRDVRAEAEELRTYIEKANIG